MPELPEVETVARNLRRQILNATFEGFDTRWPRHIARPNLAEVESRLLGRRVHRLWRRGKYVIIDLDDGQHLLVHLKMSGQLLVLDGGEERNKHDHTIFELNDGRQLRFRDVRKFGRVHLVHDVNDVVGNLGPEPLEPDFTPGRLHDLLARRKRVLKPLLLDQTFIAGVGNIYADEALHHARLDPRRVSNSLSRAESKALYGGIVLALRKGIDLEGASIDDYRKPDGSEGAMHLSLVAYGQEGQECYRCGAEITRIRLGGRSTHYCPGCQR